MIIGEKLKRLLENNKSNNICKQFLKKEKEDEWINDIGYLDIAITNPNKIGYISIDRKERFGKNVENYISDKIIDKIVQPTKEYWVTHYDLSIYRTWKDKTWRVRNVDNEYKQIRCSCLEINQDLNFNLSDLKQSSNLIKTYCEIKVIYNFFDETLRSKFAYMTSPGKLVNKLEITASNKEVQEFATLFYQDIIGLAIDGLHFELMNGESIRKYYYEGSYSRKGGTLNSSCMRHEQCKPFMDIYAKNEEKVSLLVLFNNQDKVEGRALVWKCNKEEDKDEITLMDRIYVTNDNYVEYFRTYAKNKKWHYKWQQDASYKKEIICPPEYTKKTMDLYVDLKTKFSSYPYLDTFTYMSEDRLRNNGNFEHRYELCSIGGEPRIDEEEPTVFSEYYDEDIPEDDAVYSNYLSSWIWDDESCTVTINGRSDYMPTDHDEIYYVKGNYYFKDYVIFSKWEDEYIPKEDSVFSNYHNSYMLERKCTFYNEDYIHRDYIDEYKESIEEKKEVKESVGNE